MKNHNLLDESDEKSQNFLSSVGDKLKKILVPKNKKKIFEDYQLLLQEIMEIVEDIENLRNINYKNSDNEIKALEFSKKVLEKKLVDIEKNFYDVKKGLWLGVARDLLSENYEPFLLYLPWKNLHNHFEVYGTSGFGKSRLMAVILRQMIHFGWSIMAVDPKGGDKQEIPQWIYDFAAEAGRNSQVVRIMATYPEISEKGNILFGMSNDEICSMGASLVVSGSGTASSDEQFYSGQVYRTLNGILLGTTFLEAAAYNKDDIDSMIRTEVKKYLDAKEYKGQEYLMKDNDNELVDIHNISYDELKSSTDENVKHLISPFSRTLITFRELSYFANFERINELHSIVKIYPVDNPKLEKLRNDALKVLNDIITKEKAFFEKVGDSLSILLSQLAYGPIGSIMCDIRINPIMQRILDKEGVIIIFQPAPMRFEKVSEMMIKCYTRMFLSLFGTVGTSGRGIHNRIALVVDEAKPMMFPGIEEIYNKARSLGMTIGAFYQSKSDLKFKLGEILADIVQDNTGTSIAMKQVSESSRDEVALSYGKKKVAVNVAMKENDDAGGRSTVVYEDRELISSSDMDELGIGEGVVKHYGQKLHVIFPYQSDPSSINVTMPKLMSEKLTEKVSSIESVLLRQQTRIDEYNSEETINRSA